jgi:hypothetical protein
VSQGIAESWHDFVPIEHVALAQDLDRRARLMDRNGSCGWKHHPHGKETLDV